MTEALSVLSIVVSGAVLGGLQVGLLVIEPVLRELKVDHYRLLNTLLAYRMDKLMPALVVLAALGDVALVVIVDHMTAAVLYGLAAAFLCGIAVVSRLRARPLYEWVERIDPTDPPPEWEDVRLRWRTVHQVRVGLGAVAVSLGAVAATVSL
ncbi:anthrone oxygenase family protein [Streptomyces sp. NPDC059010]|uniref:anthrone oxygenase family protein n=1 Tax=unclassified Streptomyces TaxID=2593676 RepID=UPI0036AB9413